MSLGIVKIAEFIPGSLLYGAAAFLTSRLSARERMKRVPDINSNRDRCRIRKGTKI